VHLGIVFDRLIPQKCVPRSLEGDALLSQHRYGDLVESLGRQCLEKLGEESERVRIFWPREEDLGNRLVAVGVDEFSELVISCKVKQGLSYQSSQSPGLDSVTSTRLGTGIYRPQCARTSNASPSDIGLGPRHNTTSMAKAGTQAWRQAVREAVPESDPFGHQPLNFQNTGNLVSPPPIVVGQVREPQLRTTPIPPCPKSCRMVRISRANQCEPSCKVRYSIPL
jgi:hypothetical protein